MKRIILTVLIVLLSLSICVAEEKKLNIVTDDWPPYEFKAGEAGNEYITGFSTEVIIAVLKKMNVGINERIKQHPWARGEKMVIDGSADMLYTAADNPERAKLTHYPTESLMESSWSFFIRAEDAGKLKYNSFEDLKGQKIGVVRGYSYTPELWQFMKAENNFEEVASDDFNVKKLVGKRFNYIIMDYGNGKSLLKNMGLSDKVVPIENPIKSISLYAIFSKNTVDKDFVDKFSAELKAFKATQDYKAIYEKYIGK
ncbi:MAG: transporter substrate-binding domain-containing protein [Desulfamplus sp.]|nr:transporter substrate-binding domain-containing protein [Desulfamplus sp.]